MVIWPLPAHTLAALMDASSEYSSCSSSHSARRMMMRSSLEERERPDGLESEAMPSARRCRRCSAAAAAADAVAMISDRALFFSLLRPDPCRLPPWPADGAGGGEGTRLLGAEREEEERFGSIEAVEGDCANIGHQTESTSPQYCCYGFQDGGACPSRPEIFPCQVALSCTQHQAKERPHTAESLLLTRFSVD